MRWTLFAGAIAAAAVGCGKSAEPPREPAKSFQEANAIYQDELQKLHELQELNRIDNETYLDATLLQTDVDFAANMSSREQAAEQWIKKNVDSELPRLAEAIKKSLPSDGLSYGTEQLVDESFLNWREALSRSMTSGEFASDYDPIGIISKGIVNPPEDFDVEIRKARDELTDFVEKAKAFCKSDADFTEKVAKSEKKIALERDHEENRKKLLVLLEDQQRRVDAAYAEKEAAKGSR